MQQLETVSTVEALEDALERRILEGHFRPGEHLREIELAQEYHVGRNTLRAAFDGLTRCGLLEKERNRGVFVRVLTRSDLAEIYGLRTALEVQASRVLAARRVVPQAAREALIKHRKLGARSQRRPVVEADLAFHRAIVVAAGNSRLARAHRDLEVELRLCLAQLVHGYATVAQLADEHEELLRAIESGRPATAEAAIRQHLENATAWLIDHVADSRPG